MSGPDSICPRCGFDLATTKYLTLDNATDTELCDVACKVAFPGSSVTPIQAVRELARRAMQIKTGHERAHQALAVFEQIKELLK